VQILSEPKIFTQRQPGGRVLRRAGHPVRHRPQQTANNGSVTQTLRLPRRGHPAQGIRPRITNNKDVDLRVNLQLSSIVSGARQLFGGFVVDRRQTTTQLILRDRQTVVISGILRKQDSDITRKVPLLGDIPLLGALFTSKEKSVKSTELLVFITPIVVENPEERQKLNEPYQDRLNQMRLRLQDPEKEGKGAEESGESKPKKKTAQDFGYDG
jgi:general secretion pathway protein D